MRKTVAKARRKEDARQAQLCVLQGNLFRGLQIRFQKVPDEVVNRIRATTDGEQLLNCFYALLRANKLADVGITPRE
jgi:hypothetical protein